MMHYRSDLAKMMALDSTNQEWRCLHCSVVYPSEKSMVYHLLATHSAIAEHIPTKDSVEIQHLVKKKNSASHKQRSKKPKRIISDKNDYNQQKEVDKNDGQVGHVGEVGQVGRVGRDGHESKCNICNKHFADNRSLLRHKACVHFRQAILNMFQSRNQSQNECGACAKYCTNETELLSHIANVHDGLKFISAEI
jgi:hypothetical protein